ncbi:cytochrome c biogenesis protein ResB [Nocardioides euryhalodurans]|uniref:Cytochrome c biogenesis protein ResB n=1 Tax=Nocardioides euryhalodurans TaxID=2518370 RepID=A0A4P7GKE5_9ACTN|nr:cytochrome c biogenesis protein ResB [Nocardioides euryhalodurans]QBR92520.1 cytochrome c biogenesis protein ResB [Nocardioides euryhalodurans]
MARPTRERRSGELTFTELLRWSWRQLTSMRTALVLLLLLALAAIPGSVIPQQGVDSIKTSRWQDDHPTLTPVYERLGLFDVYSSPWFAAIYLLLMISLVGCFIPRIVVYAKALRAQPPATPRNLDRLPDHTAYTTTATPAEVLDRARASLRGYRVVDRDDSVSAERGYLREAGNLLFHVSVLVVLVGFAMGGLFGYQGGVILVVGNGMSNNLTQYDDFDPGSLFGVDDLDDFYLDVDDFDVEWVADGPAAGQARKFVSHVTYQEGDGEPQEYDLRVNHPLSIGDTEVFLIGHGYAPVITVRDGNGDVVYSGPTVFLPEDQSFQSIGVVKAPDARPTQIGLEGWFYPTYAFTDETGPFSIFGRAENPAISMLVYAGDLGMDTGAPQSVYALDKDGVEPVLDDEGKPFRVDLPMGESVELPDGLGTVSFDGLERWNKITISQTPGKLVALAGVVLALVGLLGSLYIRPRRVWVRAREGGAGTLVEVAVLDRSGNGDAGAVLDRVVTALRDEPVETDEQKESS